jgi:hypothetical protein
VVSSPYEISFFQDTSFGDKLSLFLKDYVKGDFSNISFLTELMERGLERLKFPSNILNEDEKRFCEIMYDLAKIIQNHFYNSISEEYSKKPDTKEERKDIAKHFKIMFGSNQSQLKLNPKFPSDFEQRAYFHVHKDGYGPSPEDESSSMLFDLPMYVFVTNSSYSNLEIYRVHKGESVRIMKKELKG